jgi:hypothetical protein
MAQGKERQARPRASTGEIISGAPDVAEAHLRVWRRVLELKREHLTKWESFRREHPSVPIDRTLASLRESIADYERKIRAVERRLGRAPSIPPPLPTVNDRELKELLNAV